MKKVFVLTFVLVLVTGFLFFRNEVSATLNEAFYYSPCDTPIKYSIGNIDPQFEITKEELITDTRTAANIWSNTQGKQLFEYDPKASFTINMVYDDRQELTSKISELDTDLKQKQNEIDPKIEDFKRRQGAFEAKVKSLNERINYWNGQGGAPKEEYDKLVTEQNILKEEAASLNSEAERLGQSTSEYNLGAQKLNSAINDYKQVLEFTPEEGLYEQVGGKRKISIYIDVNEEEFLHTLAHELGHALGLDHINNPNAIMYPQTTAVLTPITQEINNLTEICRKRTIFEEAQNRITVLASILKERFEKR